MNNLILLSHIIEQSLNTTLEACLKVSCMYKNVLSNLPFPIDILGEALRSENLKETAHCRILHRILQNKEIQNSFIQHFLPDIDYSFDSIQIPYPDKHRIDLTIKSNTFFLIIENKINGACEQHGQIYRYVQFAQQTYPSKQIYVLYLGGETNTSPSEFSMSASIKELLKGRIICKNYKDDITPWISSVYKQIEFTDQPFLKSALLAYKTYLENKYNLNEMNNKLDKTLIETLGLESLSLSEKISLLQDQIANIDKIQERLSIMLSDYKEQRITQDIKNWYDECSSTLSNNPVLTMENDWEFGFDFRYRNTDFRCCISFDDNDDPYWGIAGLTENIESRPKVFDSLKHMIIQCNNGFHNNEYNTKEWVISDYERREFIVERFITLTRLICNSESCTIIED